jgi:hypothetical protein
LGIRRIRISSEPRRTKSDDSRSKKGSDGRWRGKTGRVRRSVWFRLPAFAAGRHEASAGVRPGQGGDQGRLVQNEASLHRPLRRYRRPLLHRHQVQEVNPWLAVLQAAAAVAASPSVLLSVVEPVGHRHLLRRPRRLGRSVARLASVLRMRPVCSRWCHCPKMGMMMWRTTRAQRRSLRCRPRRRDLETPPRPCPPHRRWVSGAHHLRRLPVLPGAWRHLLRRRCTAVRHHGLALQATMRPLSHRWVDMREAPHRLRFEAPLRVSVRSRPGRHSRWPHRHRRRPPMTLAGSKTTPCMWRSLA